MGIIFCAVFYEFRTENGDAKKPIQYRHADISKNHISSTNCTGTHLHGSSHFLCGYWFKRNKGMLVTAQHSCLADILYA